MDAVLSPLVEAVGGRQSARTIHFIIAWAFVAFVLIHLFEVLISGVFNQLRGMITGYYKVDAGKGHTSDPDETISAEERSHD
jgi:thiosulfate reductase cytochrome b subunit